MSFPPLIITAALTGVTASKKTNPAVPLTATEIADDAARAVAAGAAIVRLDARDGGGAPTLDPDLYRAIVTDVRERCPDVIVSVSTGAHCDASLEERSATLCLEGDAKPELAALPLGSINTARGVSVNDPRTIRHLADTMRERAITPEIEIFDLGMLDTATMLVDHQVIDAEPYVTIVLGAVGALGATARNLVSCVEALPPGARWAAGGSGRHQLQMTGLAVTMGGHVRTGLADNLHTGPDRHCATNAELVAAAAGLARAFGREPATAAQARVLIGLPART
jgi:3-keto-5-aminohexanoate cleavage enzyme